MLQSTEEVSSRALGRQAEDGGRDVTVPHRGHRDDHEPDGHRDRFKHQLLLQLL